MSTDEWVTEFNDGHTQAEHRDGIPWHGAPLPRRWHRCRVQTAGRVRYFTTVCRCSCGAIAIDGGQWQERNSRRRWPAATNQEVQQ